MDQNTVNYNIKTSAELAGMKEYIESLENSIKVAKASGLSTESLEKALKEANKEYGSSALASYTAALQKQREQLVAAGKDVSTLDKQLHALNDTKPLSTWGKIKDGFGDFAADMPGLSAFQKIFNGGTLMAGGAVAGAGALVEGLKKAEEEFSKAQDKVVQLDAALANNGQLTDEYRKHLQELAEQFQGSTNVAAEDWLGVLTRLTQFGADSSNIDRYAETVKNLAGIMGGDVQRAAELFSRAMQGDTAELSRLGIHIDDNLTRLQKLDELSRQAAQRGAGQLEASTNTLHGSMQALSLAVDDVFKGLGNWMNDGGGRSAFLDALTGALNGLRSLLPDTINQVKGLKNNFDDTGSAAQAAADSAAQIKTAADHDAAAVEKLNASFSRTIQLIGVRQQLEDKLIDAETAAKLSDLDNGIGKYAGISQSQKLQAEHDIRREGEKRKDANAASADQEKIDTLNAQQKSLDDEALAKERQETGYTRQVEDLDAKLTHLQPDKDLAKANTAAAQSALDYSKTAGFSPRQEDDDLLSPEERTFRKANPAMSNYDMQNIFIKWREEKLGTAQVQEAVLDDKYGRLSGQRTVAEANRKQAAEDAKAAREKAAAARPGNQQAIEDINLQWSYRQDTAAVTDAATDRADAKKITEARRLEKASSSIADRDTPTFEREASGIAAGAKKTHDTALQETARLLNEAAQDAKAHATPESLNALKTAAGNLRDALAHTKGGAAAAARVSQEIAELTRQLAELTRKTDGLAATRNNGG